MWGASALSGPSAKIAPCTLIPRYLLAVNDACARCSCSVHCATEGQLMYSATGRALQGTGMPLPTLHSVCSLWASCRVLGCVSCLKRMLVTDAYAYNSTWKPGPQIKP